MSAILAPAYPPAGPPAWAAGRMPVHEGGVVTLFDAASGTLGLLGLARDGAGSFWDAAGTLVTAAENAPRFDHDPATGALRGLLREDARTNLLPRSEAFDNASWTKDQASISSGAATAPDGASTADKLVESSDSGTHAVTQTPSCVTGTAYTISVFAKAAERSDLRVDLNTSAFPDNAYGDFDLAAGTAVAGGGADAARIEAVGGGWYRCGVTATADATATAVSGFFLHNGSTVSYTGDGSSGLYLWGAQLEAGRYATSYIATGDSAVARAEDRLTGDPTGWFSGDGVLTFVGRLHKAAQTVGQRIFVIHDGSANNRIMAFTDANGFPIMRVDTGGSIVMQEVTDSALVDGTEFTMRLQIAADDFAFKVDDDPLETDSAGAVPSGLDDMEIGEQFTGGLSNSLHLRSLTWAPGARIAP